MKDTIEEDRVLLLPDERAKKFDAFLKPNFEIATVKGASNQLEKWPTYLLLVFLAAAIIVIIVSLFVLITAFTIPVLVSHENRIAQKFSNETSRNVYFVKMDNRPWTITEFCYVESAARENPLFNIHLVNLRHADRAAENATRSSDLTLKFMDLITQSMRRSRERYLKMLLTSENANVRTLDASVQDLFKGTNLANIAENLDEKTLQMAAATYLIWNSSGIALNPDQYCNVKYVSQFLYKNANGTGEPDERATIDPKNNIQATGVACQAFMGFLLQEIVKDQLAGQEYTLKSSLNEFCPSVARCAEVRILKETLSCINATLDCPIVQHFALG